MSAPLLILLALFVEVVFSWPAWLRKSVQRPIVSAGALISRLAALLNTPGWPKPLRYLTGILLTLLVTGLAAGAALAMTWALPDTVAGFVLQALLASSLLASRSLYEHVLAVARPLLRRDLVAARASVSRIVGRDPSELDEAAVARASLESLAENASDGVVAPLFWGAIFGLPGIAACKAINTFDSVIGHRNDRYQAFCWASARLHDLVNLVPARLTGIAFAAASGSTEALLVMLRDARLYRSPNAGWPQSALAGALGVRLSGPRSYDGEERVEPWVNRGRPDPDAVSIYRGLKLYALAMSLVATVLVAIILLTGRV